MTIPPEDNPSQVSPKTVRRINVVGRMTLYCMTVFGIMFLITVAASMLWLVPAVAGADWYVRVYQIVLCAMLIIFGITFVQLFMFQRWFVPPRDSSYSSLQNSRVHVGLTAYNDEACIAAAVRDFKSSPLVHKVIVVENNSKDRTREEAIAGGADEVITETVPGYGSCCQRTMLEASKDLGPKDVIILCEGDLTFSARDVAKFLAYLENCDLVLGTRATQELRDQDTQMDWLLNPGNQLVAKIMQTRFWGTRLTDMGCTYRAMRVESYLKIKEHFAVLGNHFSPHMVIETLKLNLRVIEIPIVFKKRGGMSKGVGSNKAKATKVALAMLKLIYKA